MARPAASIIGIINRRVRRVAGDHVVRKKVDPDQARHDQRWRSTPIFVAAKSANHFHDRRATIIRERDQVASSVIVLHAVLCFRHVGPN